MEEYKLVITKKEKSFEDIMTCSDTIRAFDTALRKINEDETIIKIVINGPDENITIERNGN